jgi:hypothetical protein
MFIGPCIIVIVEEWKTNLMSLAILFNFLCAQHVSGINISIIRSLRLCCWFAKSVVLFCKDGWFSVSVNLRCIVVCVWCDVFCRFVVVGRRILIDIRFTKDKGRWRRIWNSEICNLYKDLNTMDDIKIRRLGWAGHIIRVEYERIPQKGS